MESRGVKDWAADHPKAKLMTRKRAAIVKAAEEAFLRVGYSGASMEMIAQAAGVSIMTLYRHAESKDDLFAAVIEGACHPDEQAQQDRLDGVLQIPLVDILTFVGVMFQERLNGPTTTSLLRVVMTEVRRFPHLGDLAYEGLIGSHLTALNGFLSDRPELGQLDPEQRRALGGQFFNRLIGLDGYRVLLGLQSASEQEMRERARLAAEETITAAASS